MAFSLCLLEVESAKVILNEVFHVSIQIVNRSATPLDLVLKIGDVLHQAASEGALNTAFPSEESKMNMCHPFFTLHLV